MGYNNFINYGNTFILINAIFFVIDNVLFFIILTYYYKLTYSYVS